MSTTEFLKRYEENDLAFQVCNLKLARRPVPGADGAYNYVVGRVAPYDYTQALTTAASRGLEQLRNLCAGSGCVLIADLRDLHVSPHYGLGVRYATDSSEIVCRYSTKQELSLHPGAGLHPGAWSSGLGRGLDLD